MDIMDTSYIKLCAEIAYNEVIFEACLEEGNALNESNIIDKIKSIYSVVKKFIINLFYKFNEFIKDKIIILKKKIDEYKKKKEYINQESTLLNENNEDIINYEKLIDQLYKEYKNDIIKYPDKVMDLYKSTRVGIATSNNNDELDKIINKFTGEFIKLNEKISDRFGSESIRKSFELMKKRSKDLTIKFQVNFIEIYYKHCILFLNEILEAQKKVLNNTISKIDSVEKEELNKASNAEKDSFEYNKSMKTSSFLKNITESLSNILNGCMILSNIVISEIIHNVAL